MSFNDDLIYETKKKIISKYPRFGSEIAARSIRFRNDLKYHTAATDGKNVFIDPNYFASLDDDDRIFLISHEIMHIKFAHMFRLIDKNGEKRDLDIWNKATDAIINANLQRDGFKIPEGAVNMPEARKYTAEEMYEILLKQKENEQNQQENGQGNQNSEQSECQNSNDGQKSDGKNPASDHSYWEDAFEQQQNQDSSEKESQEQKGESKEQKDANDEQKNSNIDEKAEFEENRREKREKFKARRIKAENEIRGEKDETIELGDIGKSKEEIDWKLLLRREIEKSETIWSQRRSIAENNFAYRLEENEIEEEAETEVMIDVSGSVDLDLVKAFLRQLKPLLRESKLRVGCFNTKFFDFIDINNKNDIEHFMIPKEARGSASWGTDLDLAARSFTKEKITKEKRIKINKIVFTDGYASDGCMPKEDLKRENIIWIVYGNKNFKPCCGKVIQITEKQLEKLNQIDKNSER